MSVLIVSPSFTPNIGGIETHLNDLCTYLQKKRKVFVITFQPLTTKAKGLKFEHKHNLLIRRVQWCGNGFLNKLENHPILQMIYLGPPLFLFTLFFILRHFKELSVLHAHGLTAALIIKVLNKVFKKRIVCSLHYTYNFDREPLMKKFAVLILQSFDVIITFSEISRTRCVRIGLPGSKVIVSHHWVDQDFFKPLSKHDCRKLFGFDKEFIVLFVGRLVPKKGVLSLIDAVSSVKYKIVCLIVGDGPLSPKIAQIQAENKNIKFMGRVKSEQLVKLYNASDVVIIPSLYEGDEGMRVLIEALSCGKPVIASNVGSFPSLLDKSVGILVEPRVESIRNAIKYLYENPDMLNYLTSNARKFAIQNFNEKNAETIEKSYFLDV
jgi:glycosyltransferase involved in cell wall biosynthesis